MGRDLDRELERAGETAPRVAHITVVHRASDTRIHHKQCRTLAAAGYDVHLLCGGVSDADADDFSLHPISHSPERARLREQPRRQLSALRTAIELDADLYHLHDPHLVPLGMALQRRGARVVYDMHEDHRLNAYGKLAHRPLARTVKPPALGALESLARRRFDAVVYASEALAERFPSARAIVLNNFPLLREFPHPIVRSPVSPPRVLYLGLMRPDRGFETLFAAAGLLPADLEARVRIVGELRPDSLADRVAAAPWAKRIELVGALPRAEALRELPRATIGVVVEQPRLNAFEGWRMNKLFEYMAAGLPIVIPDAPGWREIVERHGCGVVADTGDPAAVASAIEGLLRDPDRATELGRRGRQAVVSEFSWERQAPRLLSLYERLLGVASPSTGRPETAVAAAEERLASAVV